MPKYTPTPDGTKECHRCHDIKPLTDFNNDKNAPGGKDRWCRDCKRAYYGYTPNRGPYLYKPASDGYRHCSQCGALHPATKEFFRWSAQSGIGYKCRECSRKQARDYHALYPEKAKAREARRDREKRREYYRRFRAANRERLNEHMRAYQQTHLEVYRLGAQRRKARKRSLPDCFTLDQWQHCLDWWNGCCAYCGAQQGFWNKMTADHVLALTASDCPGTVVENMIPACLSCNSSKHARDVVEWTTLKFGKRKSTAILARIASYFEWLNGNLEPTHDGISRGV